MTVAFPQGLLVEKLGKTQIPSGAVYFSVGRFVLDRSYPQKSGSSPQELVPVFAVFEFSTDASCATYF